MIGEDCISSRVRPDNVALKDNLRRFIKRLITEMNCRSFISGMHRGIEQLGAELVLALKERYKLTFWGILASEEQWIQWPDRDRERFFKLMELADFEYRASNGETSRSRLLQLQVIEEEADVLLVLRGKYSEALRSIFVRAVKKGKQIYLMDPKSAEIFPYLDLL